MRDCDNLPSWRARIFLNLLLKLKKLRKKGFHGNLCKMLISLDDVMAVGYLDRSAVSYGYVGGYACVERVGGQTAGRTQHWPYHTGIYSRQQNPELSQKIFALHVPIYFRCLK